MPPTAVILRDIRDEDLDTFFEHWVDPEPNRVAAFTAENPNDRDAFDARWSQLRANDDVTNRTIEVDGVVIGVISSWTQDGDREVTYWLGREHWGKGLATRALEAFLEWGIRLAPPDRVDAASRLGREVEGCAQKRRRPSAHRSELGQ